MKTYTVDGEGGTESEIVVAVLVKAVLLVVPSLLAEGQRST